MKKFNFSLLAGLLLLISASVCAENTPEKVQETFKKMYPKVTTCLLYTSPSPRD